MAAVVANDKVHPIESRAIGSAAFAVGQLHGQDSVVIGRKLNSVLLGVFDGVTGGGPKSADLSFELARNCGQFFLSGSHAAKITRWNQEASHFLGAEHPSLRLIAEAALSVDYPAIGDMPASTATLCVINRSNDSFIADFTIIGDSRWMIFRGDRVISGRASL